MARNLTPAESAQRRAFVTTRLRAGAMQKEVAAELGIATSTLREWMACEGLLPSSRRKRDEKPRQTPMMQARATSPRMDRPCRCCGQTFSAERADGAWQRLCIECRQASTSPYEPNSGGLWSPAL